MNRLENRRLIEEIEILREQLHRSCVSNGKMTPSDDAYRISIKLDQLILEIMKAG
ncbi:MAG TPA: aspartyl-phosphate phosphatase Spo0E family protein [Bacillota bacterium]|nr:aspartyl-phosphate phosphatase Spo0E family protein [Bacillota bacterium]HOB87507.1 aspartyl-phosphate phosphatase Spo0E family protein [Bacillota bacterium]HOP68492.1 aspartyl-phosphate phosphatase Spo0E family protein [Bacillota bacterium]HPT33279.1 aspartyl-phosphate phosphatase Spo0E family protein [Bacillota bacterium]HQD06012.1 aspartyl-phosphate phosphatase Spo0E family protein [Bacillota bacterium]